MLRLLMLIAFVVQIFQVTFAQTKTSNMKFEITDETLKRNLSVSSTSYFITENKLLPFSRLKDTTFWNGEKSWKQVIEDREDGFETWLKFEVENKSTDAQCAFISIGNMDSLQFFVTSEGKTVDCFIAGYQGIKKELKSTTPAFERYGGDCTFLPQTNYTIYVKCSNRLNLRYYCRPYITQYDRLGLYTDKELKAAPEKYIKKDKVDVYLFLSCLLLGILCFQFIYISSQWLQVGKRQGLGYRKYGWYAAFVVINFLDTLGEIWYDFDCLFPQIDIPVRFLFSGNAVLILPITYTIFWQNFLRENKRLYRILKPYFAILRALIIASLLLLPIQVLLIYLKKPYSLYFTFQLITMTLWLGVGCLVPATLIPRFIFATWVQRFLPPIVFDALPIKWQKGKQNVISVEYKYLLSGVFLVVLCSIIGAIVDSQKETDIESRYKLVHLGLVVLGFVGEIIFFNLAFLLRVNEVEKKAEDALKQQQAAKKEASQVEKTLPKIIEVLERYMKKVKHQRDIMSQTKDNLDEFEKLQAFINQLIESGQEVEWALKVPNGFLEKFWERLVENITDELSESNLRYSIQGVVPAAVGKRIDTYTMLGLMLIFRIVIGGILKYITSCLEIHVTNSFDEQKSVLGIHILLIGDDYGNQESLMRFSTIKETLKNIGATFTWTYDENIPQDHAILNIYIPLTK